MLSAVYPGDGQPLIIENRADPIPAAGEVQVQLQAAALNHRDLWITKGLYPGVTPPVVLGSDGAGVVSGIASDVSEWNIGDEVIINPAFDWGEHEAAQSNDFTILGSPRDGCCATHICVPAGQLARKPAHLSWPQAAALPLAGLTAWRALHSRGQTQAGETVLISGVGGGVASYALQFALAAGATVIVTSSNESKRNQALEFGATAAFDYREQDWPKQLLSAHGGVDVVIDGAAGPGFNDFLSCARPGARVVCYGGTAGLPENINVRALFWKQVSILGSTMGSPSDFMAMLNTVAQHRIEPIIDSIFPLTEINAALKHMDDAKQFGKITITCSE